MRSIIINIKYACTRPGPINKFDRFIVLNAIETRLKDPRIVLAINNLSILDCIYPLPGDKKLARFF